jgi:hypothetical protein
MWTRFYQTTRRHIPEDGTAPDLKQCDCKVTGLLRLAVIREQTTDGNAGSAFTTAFTKLLIKEEASRLTAPTSTPLRA